MTRFTDSNRQAGRPRLRPPLLSQRLVADGEGAVTNIRNMECTVCETQCWAPRSTKEADFLDINEQFGSKQISWNLFCIIKTVFKGPKLNSDSSKGKRKFVGSHHEER